MKSQTIFTTFTDFTTLLAYSPHTLTFPLSPYFSSILTKIKKCITWRRICKKGGKIGKSGKIKGASP